MSPFPRTRIAGILSLCLLLLSLLAPAAQAAPLAAQSASQAQATIGSGSCLPDDACSGLIGNVGNNSCYGEEACLLQQGNVGNNSCTDTHACLSHQGDVGNGSCNGQLACAGGAFVGNYSCNGNGACYQLTSSVGDCQLNDVQPAACDPKPDARIRRSGGELWGNNIYNLTGADQYVSMKIYAGDKRIVYISIQNDGLVPESFTVCDCWSEGSLVGYDFRFFVGRSDTEITDEVDFAEFTTPTLDPGERFVIRARVAVSNLVPRGVPVVLGIQVESVTASGFEDNVAIWVQRR